MDDGRQAQRQELAGRGDFQAAAAAKMSGQRR
jgi:hypothetical protein